MKLIKKSVRDPSNPFRKKWGYYIEGNFGRKTGIHRISKKLWFNIKYNRVPELKGVVLQHLGKELVL